MKVNVSNGVQSYVSAKITAVAANKMYSIEKIPRIIVRFSVDTHGLAFEHLDPNRGVAAY